MARIVLDPGHGGSATIPNDSTWNNAVGPNGTLEKTLTLDIGLRAAAVLKAAGHSVRMTRETDVNLRLRERAKVAMTMQADAFVSIHFNGSTNHNAQGTETLVHTSFSPASARLSLTVQDALLAVTGLTDRNKTFSPATRIKPQSLGVLNPSAHHAGTAGCLAEVSFLDRADEEVRLQGTAYRQAIAQALADGVEAFTGPALALVPQPMVEFGDAIELAALESTQTSGIEAFLELDMAALVALPTGLSEERDAGERVGLPRHPFSRSFVEGSGPPLALIAGQPDWPLLGEFVSFIEGLGLLHFEADEFLELGTSNDSGPCKDKNSFPPKELWPNIRNTALMIDAIRGEIGASIRILSCFRAPPYNSCIGGESASLHMRFSAIDFTCSAGTPEIWRRIAARLRAENPNFSGGIGVYPSRNFLHIDTRGSNADWTG